MSINDSGVKLSSAFNLRTPVPLDLRTVRPTLLDRDSIPLTYRYDGMPCYVSGNQTLYRLKGGTSNLHWKSECCLKYNLIAATAPSTSNNASEGYAEGSLWYNTVAGDTYLLISFAGNNAVWIQVNGFNWSLIQW